MKRLTKITLSAFFITCLMCSFGNAFALSVGNASDGVFNFAPKKSVKHTVTYFLPKSTSESEFVSSTLEVNDGDNLYTSLSGQTSDISGYSFSAWHASASHFRKDDTDNDAYLSTTKVNSDITVYAKYIKSNTLYFYNSSAKTHNYLTETTLECSIPTKTIYYGDKIYSYDGVEGSSRTLATDSGKYKLVKNISDWYIERIITLNVGNISWWHVDSGNPTHTDIYCFGSGIENKWLLDKKFTDNSCTFYVPQEYVSFIVCRKSASGASWDNVINQTVDIKCSTKGKGTEIYSSSHSTLYIEEDWVEGKLNYSWY